MGKVREIERDGSVGSAGGRAGALAVLCGVAALLFIALLVYSLTHAFAWDEGFHLLAAQLIRAGKRPYLDFCFPQTPLNAYWNALWIAIFGDSWRALHVVATVLSASAALLAAEYVLARFPSRDWRLGLAAATACLIVLDKAIYQFSAIAQAYALCLFLSVAAFRVAVVAVDRRSALWSGLVGLLASAAAAASLLTAPAAVVIFLWILFYSRVGRIAKAAAFLVAAVVPFLPVIWLFAQSPHKVYFNLVEYHLFFRHVHWEGASIHDLDVLTSWINSLHALLLGLLAVAGLLFIARASGWERRLRAEIYLAAWMAIAMGAEIASAHPTFWWYFQLVVPFLTIPAAVGIYAVGARLYRPDRARWPVGFVIVLMALGWGRAFYDDADSLTWSDMQQLAQKVDEVTPPNATVWADEQIYFLTHRPVPEGMEFSASHKLDLPMSQAAPLHILPGAELKRRVQAGAYSTVETCDDEDTIKYYALDELYRQSAEIASTCKVFWEFKKGPGN